jgi:RNA polymerase sigma-70 factor (ECF subfamily)
MEMTQPKQAVDVGACLLAARAGSSEALGQALEACRLYLLRIAEQEFDPALRAKGGASDLVQETFLDAQLLFERFHGTSEAELLAWLRQLLLHNLGDFNRYYHGTGKREPARENPIPDTGLPTDSDSPSAHACQAEQSEALRQALERLPEDYRTALTLRYQEDLPFEEIGQRLGRSANAARKLWLRAVQRLQQELGAPDEEPRQIDDRLR